MKFETGEIQFNRYIYLVMEEIVYWRNMHGILLTNSTSYGLGEWTNSWISMILQANDFMCLQRKLYSLHLKFGG